MAPSKDAVEAEFGRAVMLVLAGWGLENITGYSGPMTHEKVMEAHTHYSKSAMHALKAEAVARSCRKNKR